MTEQEKSSLILELEARRCSALMARDVKTLETILSRDLVHIHTNGRVDDHVGYFDKTVRAIDFITIARDPVSIRWFGDIAVATGHLKQHLRIVATGVEHKMDIMTSQVWTPEDGTWRQAHFQASLIPNH